jgi:hypothetical protein
LFETEITDEQYVGIKISPREVAELIPMTLEEAAERVRMYRNEFSGAFVLMLSLYARIKNINLGYLPLDD